LNILLAVNHQMLTVACRFSTRSGSSCTGPTALSRDARSASIKAWCRFCCSAIQCMCYNQSIQLCVSHRANVAVKTEPAAVLNIT